MYVFNNIKDNILLDTLVFGTALIPESRPFLISDPFVLRGHIYVLCRNLQDCHSVVYELKFWPRGFAGF